MAAPAARTSDGCNSAASGTPWFSGGSPGSNQPGTGGPSGPSARPREDDDECTVFSPCSGYLLTHCTDGTTIQSRDVELAAHVGKVVKVAGECYTVTASTAIVNAQNVVVQSVHDDCDGDCDSVTCACGNCTFYQNSTIDWFDQSVTCTRPNETCADGGNGSSATTQHEDTLDFLSCTPTTITWKSSTVRRRFWFSDSTTVCSPQTGALITDTTDRIVELRYLCGTDTWEYRYGGSGIWSVWGIGFDSASADCISGSADFDRCFLEIPGFTSRQIRTMTFAVQ